MDTNVFFKNTPEEDIFLYDFILHVKYSWFFVQHIEGQEVDIFFIYQGVGDGTRPSWKVPWTLTGQAHPTCIYAEKNTYW